MLLLLAQLLLLLLHGLHLSLVRHHIHVLLHAAELVLHLVAHHATSALASASSVRLGWLLTLGSSFVVTHLLATLRSDLSLLLHQHWHAFDQQLQIVLELFLVGQISPLCTLRVGLAELLEASLVLSGFVLELTVLFDLVVVDGQGSVAKLGIVELLLGGGGFIWLFEADKGVEFLLLVVWMKSQTLNLTERLKVLSKHLLCDVLCEALDVQVASLL